MAPISEELMEKIRKVAALADNAGTEGEAMAAALMLQRLMNKHGLVAEDIRDAAPEEKVVANDEGERMGRICTWKGTLAQVIAKNFRCESYWSYGYDFETWSKYVTLRFVGLEEDVKAATELYKMTVSAIYRLSDKYTNARWRKDKVNGIHWSRSDSILIGNSYKMGFIQGLAKAFKKQVADQTQAIVLTKDALVVEAVEALNLSSTGKSSAEYYKSYHARKAGEEDGKQFGEGNAVAND